MNLAHGLMCQGGPLLRDVQAGLLVAAAKQEQGRGRRERTSATRGEYRKRELVGSDQERTWRPAGLYE